MRDSFILYTSYLDQIESMSIEQRGTLFTALFRYAGGMELPEMDGVTKMAFGFIRAQIDRHWEKYDEVCRKRSEAGKKGGRPKKKSLQFKKVVDNKVSEWQGTKMDGFLRPITLFGTKFESYLQQNPGTGKKTDFNNFQERNYDMNDLERQLLES